MSDAAFSTLPLQAEIINNLATLGYEQMTPIQAASLPHVLAGKDVTAKARTGSGKTAAFMLGVLNQLETRDFEPQSLVLCPTRELATQVAEESRKLARFIPNVKVLTLCGGMPIGPQIGSLEHGAHIVVGTPGRISDHIRKGTLSLRNIRTVVLDEADRMLDMGFVDEISDIVSHTPPARQTLFFSATYPDNVQALVERFQREPEFVTIQDTARVANNIEQAFWLVPAANKVEAVCEIIETEQLSSAILFCQTRQGCVDLERSLRDWGASALALHGDMEQRERDQVLAKFSNGSASFLIATDVAARGLDIADLPGVINVDIPADPHVYVHRIGRTGRAGKLGHAWTLVTERQIPRYQAICMIQNSDHGMLDWIDVVKQRNGPEPGATRCSIRPAMVTLAIDGGKKNKIRPGDVLGALTGDAGLKGDAVGAITIFPFITYVAVDAALSKQALERLRSGKIKGKKLKVRKV
ncbi:ATP-dependent RNA helicase DbpA [Oleiphilus messinensis]|uniref:ATP-dependent RNA helicase DbpA n=1 Tax=Oleiphilus messinensis TaxID=141451 RepID=A0A1Y0I695_9GAMM|nr:ATP-dependent RNA helicase DbpA [Oleiphilus messinensis]ARU55750.1 ATP-dependent RNA helicase DbpA [Oleiphilus messinensis]